MTDSQTTADRALVDDNLRKITIFDYALHIASPIISLMSLSVIALIINYVKLGDSRNTLYEGHMRYMISTFWWTALWLVVTFLLTALTLGGLSPLMLIPVIWYLYRNIRGLLRVLDNMPVR